MYLLPGKPAVPHCFVPTTTAYGAAPAECCVLAPRAAPAAPGARTRSMQRTCAHLRSPFPVQGHTTTSYDDSRLAHPPLLSPHNVGAAGRGGRFRGGQEKGVRDDEAGASTRDWTLRAAAGRLCSVWLTARARVRVCTRAAQEMEYRVELVGKCVCREQRHRTRVSPLSVCVSLTRRAPRCAGSPPRASTSASTASALRRGPGTACCCS